MPPLPRNGTTALQLEQSIGPGERIVAIHYVPVFWSARHRCLVSQDDEEPPN